MKDFSEMKIKGRIPSLDGIRAFSIFLVLLGHAKKTEGFPFGGYPHWNYIVSADLGVTIFFVLSGFLISSLLFEEEKMHQKISLKNFYIRRALRIFPVFYSYLLFLFVLGTFDLGFQISNSALLPAATYTTLLWGESVWETGHTWSLAIEEQFYLIWPLLICIFGKKMRLILLLIAIPLFSIIRVVFYKVLEWDYFGLFVTQADPIFFGCLLAYLFFYFPRKAGAFFKNHVVSGRLISFSIIYVTIIFEANKWVPFFTVPFARTLQSIAICYFVGSFILVREGLLFRILNQRQIAFVGVLSYSLYVWQQFFLTPNQPIFWVQKFPQNIVIVFLISYLSLRLIEQPILKFKKNFYHKLQNS